MTATAERTDDPVSPTDSPPKKKGMMRRLYDWVLSLAERKHSAWWLFGLSFAEASFFPIPPDVLLIPLCLGSAKRAMKFALICSIASVLGGMAGYGIGYFVWDAVDQFFYKVVPGVDEAGFQSFQDLYDKWGVSVVLLAGFTIIPFKVFTIASGLAAMSFWPFVGAAAVSRSARFFLVAWLLAKFGEPMKRIIDRHFNLLAFLFAALLIGGFFVIKILLH